MTSDEDQRLIAAARRGDARAFSNLVGAHQQAVRGFLRRYCSDWDSADDIAQEAFVIAWTRLSRFEGRSSFRSWVCGVGLRLARDGRRSQRRAAARERAWLEGQADAAPAAAPLEDRIALAQALRGLPETQRAAVALCLGEGFSHAEAAAVLCLPLGTVKSHVSRGGASGCCRLWTIIMSEERLRLALASAAPAAQDRAFVLAVMRRAEAERFPRGLALKMLRSGLLAALAAAGAAPTLGWAVQHLAPLQDGLLLAAALLMTLSLLRRNLAPAR